MQNTLDELVHWGTTCGLRFNPHKTNAVFFTRSRTHPYAPLLVDGTAVPYSLRAKYLGIEMDRRLWWDDHVQRKIAEGKKLLNALLSATRGNWGPRPEIAKWIYTAIIRPSISYGASVWAHDVTLKKTTSMMTSLDRAALASMAAFRPSTPTQGLAVLLGLQPLDLHLRETAMMSTI